MHPLRTTFLAFWASAAMLPAWGALSPNLITNPGNEAALVAGEITGWQEVQGSNWTQRGGSPAAFEGSFYFFAGAGAQAILRQTVDVGALSAQIDAGLLQFDFSGRVRSFEQNPADSAAITLRFLDGASGELQTFSSGAIRNTSAWQLVSTTVLAPANTRSVEINLTATRNAGTNNDGYFDDLHLSAVTAVPEPATYAMLLAGLAVTGAFVRRRQVHAR
jgi:PEP-CTERM motif